MKKYKRVICAVSMALLMISLSACGGGGEGETGGGDVSKASPEEYFLWDENNNIYGLTEEGKEQENLIIPARCEGFDLGIVSAKVKHIGFESDKNIDISNFIGDCEVLESVELPAELSMISDRAFSGCDALQSITIPANVKIVGERAFSNLDSLTTVIFEGNTEEIQEGAFRGCKALTTITFPDSITTIGEKAFYECESLTTITFPDSITTIGEEAFYECKSLQAITLPAGLKTLGKDAFLNGGLTDVNVPEGVELSEFEGGAFIQAARGINVHVVEGSWMDTHFDEVFSGGDAKDYTFAE